MRKQTILLDTNILVRYLTNDPIDQASRVHRLVTTAKPGSLELTDVILIELIFVLLSVYRQSKQQVLESIDAVLEFPAFKTNYDVWKRTLELYKKHTISIVDAYLSALSVHKKHNGAYSFDKKLHNLEQTNVKSP